MFSENSAMGAGGMDNLTDTIVTNCVFAGNTAILGGFGGGMVNEGDCEPTIANCVFTGNTALAGWGGGMYNIGTCRPTVVNCTFGGNVAGIGGGMCNDVINPNPTLTNCVFWNNSDDGGTDEGGQITVLGGTPNISYSCVQGWTGALGGTGNIGDLPEHDPLFLDADGADDVVGTEDDDLRLGPTSPCVDAADNAVPELADVITDLDGGHRVVDDQYVADTGNGTAPIVDMGAYEREVVFVDGSVGASGDGTSWAEAYKYLTEALSAEYQPDEVWVAEGIYTPTTGSDRTASFVLASHLAVYGGFPAGGGAWADRDPAPAPAGQNVTTLSGDLLGDDGPDFANNDENSYHVVSAGASTDPTTILGGFTITAGNADGPGFPQYDDDGAGMHIRYGSPTVANCTFNANTATGVGGGVDSRDSRNGDPVFVNCVFSDNLAQFYGGGMQNHDSKPTWTNCTFIGNAAPQGGGLYNEPPQQNLWVSSGSGNCPSA